MYIYIFVYVHITYNIHYLSIYLSIYPSIPPSIHPSLNKYICIYIYNINIHILEFFVSLCKSIHKLATITTWILRRRKTLRNNLGGDVICISTELPNIIYTHIFCFPKPWIPVATLILGRFEKQHEMEHQLSQCVQTLAPSFLVEFSCGKQLEAEKEQLRQEWHKHTRLIRIWYLSLCTQVAKVTQESWSTLQKAILPKVPRVDFR